MEEGSSGGRKCETTVRGTNIALRMMCLMPSVGFSKLPSGSSGCAREIGRSEVTG